MGCSDRPNRLPPSYEYRIFTLPAETFKKAGYKTTGLYRNGWVEGYFGFSQQTVAPTPTTLAPMETVFLWRGFG